VNTTIFALSEAGILYQVSWSPWSKKEAVPAYSNFWF
jgi:hypothetical protein